MSKIVFVIDTYSGLHRINNDEICDLRQKRADYIVNKGNASIQLEYISSIHNYLQLFIDYADDVFKEKTYSMDTIAPYVFPNNKVLDENKFREYIHKSIYLEREYIKYVKPLINQNNMERYEHQLLDIQTDTEWLICNFEYVYRKSIPDFELTSGSRKKLSVSDIYSASKELFFIEEIPDIKNIYLRDLKPNVIFQIRQLLEVMGKNIIGYSGIEDKDDNEIKKFTQSSWKFLHDYCKKNNGKVEFPISLNTIILLHNWSNKFVHTSYIYNNYIQFFALDIIRQLLIPPKNNIIDYKGGRGRIQLLDYGEIKVYNYNSMKAAFEEYINKLMSKSNYNCFQKVLIKFRLKKEKKANVKIKWFDNIDHVGAYVMSL